jgi:hypothetical protein
MKRKSKPVKQVFRPMPDAVKSAVAAMGVCLGVVCLVTSAAAEPTFAGAWSADVKNCRVPQEMENAPMLISPKGYDQPEVHCTFLNLVKSGRTYQAATRCSVQGDSQTGTIRIVMANRTVMNMSLDGGAAIKMHRCR